MRIPKTIEGLTPSVLTHFVSEMHPGVTITECEPFDIRRLGQQVSTAGRVKMRLRYGAGSPALPQQALIKMVIDEAAVPGMLYETEVRVYQKFLPETDLLNPACMAAAYDPATEHFILMLEDLSERKAFFPTVLDPSLTADQVAKLLDWLARLHARFWKSARLTEESAWLSSLTEGKQFDFFNADTVKWIDSFVAANSYRKDLITRIGRSPAQLWENVKAVHRYQERLFPMTLLHGDTGTHNSFHLPDGQCGFLDWQLAVRGPWPHDVHYIICTALSVADRRAHERSLVKGYLDRLASLGVADVPSLDVGMREYARAMIWGFTVGWLMVPPRNYGMEIISANLERLLAALLDHDTFGLADEVTP
jgi:aminoglycoside phosphotransferase (APT) family kinase protein